MPRITQLQLKANRESFAWSQKRTPLKYINIKVRKLRIGFKNITDEDTIQRVYNGLLGEPELKTSMAIKASGSLAEYRQYMREIQYDIKAAHDSRFSKRTYASRNTTSTSSRSRPWNLDEKPSQLYRKCISLSKTKTVSEHWALKYPNRDIPQPKATNQPGPQKKLWEKKIKIEVYIITETDEGEEDKEV